MTDYTISEYCELPSKGLIYDVSVNPTIQLRSMTTEEEMRRLSHTDFPYKTLCGIIDTCMIEPCGISSYDMCLGDYQYLLHRLRVVTYGSNYPSSSICPICGKLNKITMDLDTIPILEFDMEEFTKLRTVELPGCKKKVVLRYQTPRDVDEIAKEERDFKTKNPDSTVNIGFLIALRHTIQTVDGQRIEPTRLDQFLRKLSMKDTNILLQNATKLNEKVGIDTKINNVCSNPMCGAKYQTTFRITNEFFGPTDY